MERALGLDQLVELGQRIDVTVARFEHVREVSDPVLESTAVDDRDDLTPLCPLRGPPILVLAQRPDPSDLVPGRPVVLSMKKGPMSSRGSVEPR